MLNLSEFNKPQALLISLIVYLAVLPFVSILTSHIIDLFFPIDPSLIILIWDFLLTTIIYIISILIDNCSLIDFYWTIIPIGQFNYEFLCRKYFITNSALNIKHYIALTIVNVWGIRLTYNYIRSWVGFKFVDFRIEAIKKFTNKQNIIFWFIIYFEYFIAPGGLLYLAKVNLMPFALFSDNKIRITTLIAYFIMSFGIIYQTISDKQLYNFRRKNNFQSKGIIDEGLWYYSRHPNYFGECTFWWGVFLLSWEVSSMNNYSNIWMIIGPIGMTLLFTFGTGPWMDRHLKKRRPEYKEYMNINKSLFIPWFRNEKFKSN